MEERDVTPMILFREECNIIIELTFPSTHHIIWPCIGYPSSRPPPQAHHPCSFLARQLDFYYGQLLHHCRYEAKLGIPIDCIGARWLSIRIQRHLQLECSLHQLLNKLHFGWLPCLPGKAPTENDPLAPPDPSWRNRLMTATHSFSSHKRMAYRKSRLGSTIGRR